MADLAPGRRRQSCTFLLSVDTEEEWDWDGPLPQTDFSVSNAQELPAFHRFCQTLNIKPSYFVDYAMLEDDASRETLQAIYAMGDGEMGAHLHPWCNPPYFGSTSEAQSHLINLPLEQVEQKLEVLTRDIQTTFGSAPKSFRTGRWGTSGAILKLLSQYGYQVDSSIYPYFDVPYFCGHDVDSTPYYPDFEDPNRSGLQRKMIEVPPSAGFNRLPFSRASRLHEWLETSVARHVRPIALSWRLGLLKKLYLSPELMSKQDLILLTKTLLRGGYPIIHMYFHSSSLLPNFRTSSGIVSRPDAILDGIRTVVEYLQSEVDVHFATITEAAFSWSEQQ